MILSSLSRCTYLVVYTFLGVCLSTDAFVFVVQVAIIFDKWHQICNFSSENDDACTGFVLHLHQSGLLKGDDITDSFFRKLTVI